jgi:hypothetical protein
MLICQEHYESGSSRARDLTANTLGSDGPFVTDGPVPHRRSRLLRLLLLSLDPRRFLSALRHHLIVFRRPAARRCIRWQAAHPMRHVRHTLARGSTARAGHQRKAGKAQDSRFDCGRLQPCSHDQPPSRKQSIATWIRSVKAHRSRASFRFPQCVSHRRRESLETDKDSLTQISQQLRRLHVQQRNGNSG